MLFRSRGTRVAAKPCRLAALPRMTAFDPKRSLALSRIGAPQRGDALLVFKERQKVDFPAGWSAFGGSMSQIRRRQLLLTAGSLLVAPSVAFAQQKGAPRRVAVLIVITKADPEIQVQIAAFVKGLQELGWKDGSNLRIDYRYAEKIGRASCRERV